MTQGYACDFCGYEGARHRGDVPLDGIQCPIVSVSQ